MSEVSEFHQRLKLASRGVSQTELARRTGTAQSAINRIFRGGDPSFSTLMSIARALDVKVAWLVGEAGKVGELSADQASMLLDSVEQMLQDTGTISEDAAETLSVIATDGEMPDPVRARADLALRFAFPGKPEGDAAEKRQLDRGQRVKQEMRKAEAIVSDAGAAAGWMPPTEIRNHLVNLVRFYRVEGDFITVLLYDLARLIPDKD